MHCSPLLSSALLCSAPLGSALLCSALLCCGVVWCGVVWHGMAWHGMAWDVCMYVCMYVHSLREHQFFSAKDQRLYVVGHPESFAVAGRPKNPFVYPTAIRFKVFQLTGKSFGKSSCGLWKSLDGRKMQETATLFCRQPTSSLSQANYQ